LASDMLRLRSHYTQPSHYTRRSPHYTRRSHYTVRKASGNASEGGGTERKEYGDASDTVRNPSENASDTTRKASEDSMASEACPRLLLRPPELWGPRRTWPLPARHPPCRAPVGHRAQSTRKLLPAENSLQAFAASTKSPCSVSRH